MLAAVWFGAAALYGASQLGLTKWQFRQAAVGIVGLDLFLTLRGRAFREWLFDITIGQWPRIDAETERKPEEAGRFAWIVLGVMVMVYESMGVPLRSGVIPDGAAGRPPHPHPAPMVS